MTDSSDFAARCNRCFPVWLITRPCVRLCVCVCACACCVLLFKYADEHSSRHKDSFHSATPLHWVCWRTLPFCIQSALPSSVTKKKRKLHFFIPLSLNMPVIYVHFRCLFFPHSPPPSALPTHSLPLFPLSTTFYKIQPSCFCPLSALLLCSCVSSELKYESVSFQSWLTNVPHCFTNSQAQIYEVFWEASRPKYPKMALHQHDSARALS